MSPPTNNSPASKRRLDGPVKLSLVTLGCPKNQVDSEIMQGSLAVEGFVLTDDPAGAHVIVVNTCGFVDSAKQESIDALLDFAKLKRQGECRVLIAAGCLAQRYPEELAKELPELDALIGTGDFPKIATICNQLLERPATADPSGPAESFVTSAPYLYNAGSPRRRSSPGHWAYVKISEGCNYRCSFCAIPHFRGDLVSRGEEDILTEVRSLAGEGVREINLIAQSLTSYGWDRRDRDALDRLLRSLTGIDGIDWIRLYYTYPTDLSDALLDLMASEPTICNYVDIPLQHINDRILQKMNRKGDSRLIRDLISRIRTKVPGVSIRSTFIVGYPGETEEAFEELCGFVEEAQFNRIGVFTYSHEDHTSAYAIEDGVPQKIKGERQARLLNLQSEISLAKHRSLLGSVQTVLVDGVSPESGILEGRLEGQAPEIDGVVILEGTAEPGNFVKAEVTDATDSDLTGRIVGPEGHGSPCPYEDHGNKKGAINCAPTSNIPRFIYFYSLLTTYDSRPPTSPHR
jgi:ribosomal protein S12 methylthiotransferase